jgi:hypothetical protein
MSLAFGLHSQKIANAFTNHTESGQDEPAHRKIAGNGLLSVMGRGPKCWQPTGILGTDCDCGKKDSSLRSDGNSQGNDQVVSSEKIRWPKR